MTVEEVTQTEETQTVDTQTQAETQSVVEKTLNDLLKDNPKLQSEYDKSLAKYGETISQKSAIETQKAVEEAQKMATMTAEERALKEANDIKEKYESMIKEITLEKEKTETEKYLIEKNLSKDLMDVFYNKEISTKDSIEIIAKLFTELKETTEKETKKALTKGNNFKTADTTRTQNNGQRTIRKMTNR